MQQKRIISFAGSAFLVIACLAVYIPAIRGGFVWDDDDYVTQNPLLVAPDGLYKIWFSKEQTSQYFPLVYTTFRLEHKLWGFNPLGYHITNIILHIINSLLLWRLLRLLDVPGAWLAAAIFALHPVQVESAAWITERKNVLMTMFFFLSLLAWVRFMEKPAIYLYFLSLVFYILALFSKTTACTLPAALVLILWMKNILIDKRRWQQITPYVVLGLAMGIFVVWREHYILGTSRLKLELNPVERLLLAARALWFYIGKLIWPTKLTFSYPKWDISWTQPVQYLWLIAWVVVGWCMWHWRERLGRGVIAGIVFFVATLSPMLGFISLYTFRYTYVADHYQYVASIGLIAIVAALGYRAAAKIRLLPIVAAIILAGYGVLSRQQCYTYRNLETLWRDTLTKNPNSWIAYYNLGIALKEQGRLDEAISQYRQALQIKPDLIEAYNNLAMVFTAQNKFTEAVDVCQQAMHIKPDDPDIHYNLGIALGKYDRLDEAADHFRQALRLKPDYADACYNLGRVLHLQGKLDEAIVYYQQAINLNPNFPKAHNNLGVVFSLQGKFDEAAEHFRQALRLKPDYTEAQANLEKALQTQVNPHKSP